MSFLSISRVEKLVVDNSPALLTAVGVVGTATTAILTGQATIKAVRFLDNDVADWEKELLTPAQKVGLVWKHYIPAVGSGLVTATAIISANRIGARRAAGLATAFTLAERAHSEYKERVRDKFGADKERELRAELNQERVNRTPGSSEILIAGTDSLCLDTYSGRYFRSSMEELKRAQNEVNQNVINTSYASLSDLYDQLGLERTSASDEVGWNTERLLAMQFSPALAPDGKPCIAINYDVNSNRDYWRNR